MTMMVSARPAVRRTASISSSQSTKPAMRACAGALYSQPSMTARSPNQARCTQTAIETANSTTSYQRGDSPFAFAVAANTRNTSGRNSATSREK